MLNGNGSIDIYEPQGAGFAPFFEGRLRRLNDNEQHPERHSVHIEGDCITYREGDAIVWDWTPEARDWELERRIASLTSTEEDAFLVSIDAPVFAA